MYDRRRPEEANRADAGYETRSLEKFLDDLGQRGAEEAGVNSKQESHVVLQLQAPLLTITLAIASTLLSFQATSPSEPLLPFTNYVKLS